MQSGSFRDDIQGLRGLAVLLVVLFHADGVLTGGFVGVDVFFVISGFLIGGILLRELDETGTVRLSDFFARRVRRLLPALAVMTSVTLVASMFVVSLVDAFVPAVRTALAASLFVANLHLYRASDYFAPAAELDPLLHTWSLSVEEQFYLALPILFVLGALAVGRRGVAARRLVLTAVVLLAAASLLTSIGLARASGPVLGLSEPDRLAFYAPVSRAWEFAAGVLLAAFPLRGRAASRSGVASTLGAMGLLMILVAAVRFDALTPFPGSAALLPVLGTVLVLAAGSSAAAASGTGGRVRRVLGLRPLTWLGDLSYSWYLWHWPFIVLARAMRPGSATAVVLAAVLSIAPAWVSYRFVEERFRRDRTLTGRRSLRLGLVAVGAPALLAVTLLNVADIAEQRLRSTGELSAVLDVATQLSRDIPRQFGDFDTPLDVVLIGDSHVAALHNGMSIRAEQAGISYGALWEQGCLFLVGPYTDRHCQKWQTEAFERLREADIDTVVIHGYATGRLTGLRRGTVRPIELFTPDGAPVRDSATAQRLYEAALSELVDELRVEGRRIIILSSVPDFTTSLTDRITVVQALRGASAADVVPETISLAAAAARNAPLLDIERRVAASRPWVSVLESAPFICRDACVQIEQDGTLIYLDRDHVTLAGALRLADGLLAVVMSEQGS